MVLYFQLPLICCRSQNREGNAAPGSREKDIPDCSLGSAGLNQWFHRAYNRQRNDRFNSTYPVFRVLRELTQSSCSCSLLTSKEPDGQGWRKASCTYWPGQKKFLLVGWRSLLQLLCSKSQFVSEPAWPPKELVLFARNMLLQQGCHLRSS